MRADTIPDLQIKAIDVDDDLYKIHYGEVPQSLIESIQKVHLINPPVLEAKGNGRYRIVLGFRRLQSLIMLDQKTVRASVLSSPVSGINLFEAAIYDNRSMRPFNPVECSIILNKLLFSFGQERETVVKQYMPLLGLGAHWAVLDRMLPIARLEEEIKKWVAGERLSIEAAAALQDMSAGDRRTLFHLISTLQLGKNKQKELLMLSTDVARLEGISVEQLFSSSEIMNVVEDITISPAHRAEKLREWLFRKRYPRFSAAQQLFSRLRTELALPPHIELKPPPFFEGEEYTLTLRFTTPDELAALTGILLRISGDETLKKLLMIP